MPRSTDKELAELIDNLPPDMVKKLLKYCRMLEQKGWNEAYQQGYDRGYDDGYDDAKYESIGC